MQYSATDCTPWKSWRNYYKIVVFRKYYWDNKKSIQRKAGKEDKNIQGKQETNIKTVDCNTTVSIAT